MVNGNENLKKIVFCARLRQKLIDLRQNDHRPITHIVE